MFQAVLRYDELLRQRTLSGEVKEGERGPVERL